MFIIDDHCIIIQLIYTMIQNMMLSCTRNVPSGMLWTITIFNKEIN